MKKKEFAVAVALLSASSALCLRIMKKVTVATISSVNSIYRMRFST